ncbi:MAG: hypothetical protein AAF530_08905 [Pseudomonadota bacterium]
MKILIPFIAACLMSLPAMARDITSEVQYHKDIKVLFSPNADKCGFKDEAPFMELAKEQLDKMDVPYNPDGLTTVVINITASAGGFLDQSCIAYASLRLQVDFKSNFFNQNAYEGEDTIMVIMSERDYTFPMVFYQSGTVYPSSHLEMIDKTKEQLTILFDGLAALRRQQ